MIKKLIRKKKVVMTVLLSMIATIFVASQTVEINKEENKIAAATIDWRNYLRTGNVKQDVLFTDSTGKPISQGATVKSGDSFKIQYKLNLKDGVGIEANDTMTLPLPTPMKIVSAMNEEVRDGQGNLIGYMTANPGDTSFVFKIVDPLGVGDVTLNVQAGFSTSGNGISIDLEGTEIWKGNVTSGSGGGAIAGNVNGASKTIRQTTDGRSSGNIWIGRNTVSNALKGAPLESVIIQDTVSGNQWYTNPIEIFQVNVRYNDGSNQEVMYSQRAHDFITLKDEVYPGSNTYRTFEFNLKDYLAYEGWDMADFQSWTEIKILYLATVDPDIANGEKISNKATLQINGKDSPSWNDEVAWSKGDGSGERLLGNVKLVKTDENGSTGKDLEGAEFSLYREAGTLVKTGITTDSTGSVVVPNLPVGKYYFVETKAPNGFEPPVPGTRHPFEITTSNATNNITINTTIKNTRTPDTSPGVGQVRLTKRNSKNNGLLNGAYFSLYTENGTLIKNNLVTRNGIIEEKNLPAGNYYFVETQAPNGFIPPAPGNKHPFTITPESIVAEVYIGVTVTNTPIPADRNFMFKKVSSLSPNGLQGAVFQLQQLTGGNWSDVAGKTYTTDSNGLIQLDEAAVNALGEGTFRLKEIQAPARHKLPTGGNEFTESFVITEDAVTPSSIQKTNEVINRNFTFLKQSQTGTAGLAGAEFTLQKKVGAIWTNLTPATIYTTDQNGQIKFTEEQLYSLGEGTFRMREVTAPANHDLPSGNGIYSQEFTINRETVSPASISMRNTVTNHRLELSKTGEDTGSTLLAGAEFIIQGQKADGKWYQVGTKTFTTGANGKLVVDNTTAPGLINQMLNSTEYQAYRFREIKAPHGRYQDPQYKGSPEADGNPGNKFAVAIDLTPLETAVRSTPLYFTMKNDLLRYQASIQKVDKLNNPLAGAEFTMWNEKTPASKQTNKGNATGLFTWQDLVIGETYVITETKAPNGYGLQSYHYFVSMDKNTQTIKVERSETLTGPRTTLVAGRDYQWNQSTLALSFTVVNNKVREVPKTGGMDLGIYGYLAIGATMIGLGYIGQTIYKKRRI